MAMQETLTETCESCGSFAEIGTIIQGGDDVATIEIHAADEASARAKLAEYQALMLEVSSDATLTETLSSENGETLIKAALHFSCTAEKLIFEMKARYIA